jgi:hypothetical protein
MEAGAGGYNFFFMQKERVQALLAERARPAIFQWQRKIKEAFDPNEVGDGSYLYLGEQENRSGE